MCCHSEGEGARVTWKHVLPAGCVLSSSASPFWKHVLPAGCALSSPPAPVWKHVLLAGCVPSPPAAPWAVASPGGQPSGESPPHPPLRLPAWSSNGNTTVGRAARGWALRASAAPGCLLSSSTLRSGAAGRPAGRQTLTPPTSGKAVATAAATSAGMPSCVWPPPRPAGAAGAPSSGGAPVAQAASAAAARVAALATGSTSWAMRSSKLSTSPCGGYPMGSRTVGNRRRGRGGGGMHAVGGSSTVCC